MKLLFAQSYYLKFDPKLYDAMQPYPPLGTMYAASFMREWGYEVALFDAMLAESEAEFAEALTTHRPDYAIIYEDNFNYLSKMCLTRMREAAFTMIRMAHEQGVPVILCGSDATDHAESYLHQGADYVLLGEGELTLAELLDHLTNHQPANLSDILGLAYAHKDDSSQPVSQSASQQNSKLETRNSKLETHRTPRRPDIKQVDELPFPAWDLVDVPRYKKIWYERHGYYAMNMVTTRGCPYHCNWCAKPIWGQRYNSRSPENVARELKWLKETFQPDYIWLADDIVGIRPRWWHEFADWVEKLDARVPFKCLSRADLIVRNDADVKALARAGCDIVWMGAESGSQKILNAMDKGTTVEQIAEATRRLHEVGVRVAFFLQFGYPGETRDDLEKTLQMVRDCQPDDIGMSVSYPLPGTKFHNNVKLQLGDKQNWVDSADLEMMYQGPFTTAFYRQLHIVLHKEFRSRKQWRELTQDWQKGKVRLGQVRIAAAITYRLLTLPLARMKLNRLSTIPHQGIPALPHMSLEDAAAPTPQE